MTDIHFDDLTKINVPFAFLDDDTKERLRACETLQVFNVNGWRFAYNRDTSRDWVVYREAPPPPTPDEIPWDAIRDEFVCCARDASGEFWLYLTAPSRRATIWVQEYGHSASVLNIKAGTCDWKDSLQWRPGHEPEGDQ